MALTYGYAGRTAPRLSPYWALLLAVALLFHQFVLQVHHHGLAPTAEQAAASGGNQGDDGDAGDCAICHDLALASVTLLAKPGIEVDGTITFVDVPFSLTASLSRRQLSGHARSPRGPPRRSA
jgi:hypothetical protein